MVLNCCKGITLERKKQIYWKEKGLFSKTIQAETKIRG
jgi:hypothetical protein